MSNELKKIESLINWNYMGIAAGILSIIVAIYNVQQYVKKIK